VLAWQLEASQKEGSVVAEESWIALDGLMGANGKFPEPESESLLRAERRQEGCLQGGGEARPMMNDRRKKNRRKKHRRAHPPPQRDVHAWRRGRPCFRE